MARIIVLDPIAQEGLDMLAAAPGIEYEVRTGLKGAALRSALAEFDGAICRSGVTINGEALEGNKRLKAIARAGVGTDNIDKNVATRLGIVVMNTPTGNTLSTAEHTFTLLLALSRRVAEAHMTLCGGKWDRKTYMGSQVADKTLGIVGLGRIGQEVAKRANAFQMKVMGYDPFLSSEQAQKLGIQRVDKVADMFPHIDYLTVHTPLTPETTDLIDSAAIEKLKPGCRLINCARGGIYNEAALVEGLKSGKLGGVALDVFVEEPNTTSPLLKMPNVLCTPHLGASTEEAQQQVALEAVQLLINYFSTGEVRHAVNMASVDPATLQAMKGYLDLAWRLGLLMAEWQPSGAAGCHITYRGEVTKRNTKLLTSAFCAGLLEKALDEEVNIVNAEVLLRERGIVLTEESRPDMGAFSSSMSVEVKTGNKIHVASGTLFGNNMPRLIRLDDSRLEAYIDGNLFVFTHNDVPGIIGAVGTIFGKHSVNIGHMTVGRAVPGGTAVGVLNLDTVPPKAAIDEVLSHPSITSARVIPMPPAGKLPSWLGW
ncbi:D-3-phosphoglycerate dehydrogenase [Anatilimnocola aggregata]|uniref:D-3-phosphoglycerate dehydrogenase n=1 Tax=Anatilimnocola aggregata TaxID=2528021 RepID=A0A517YDT1_9BACT|nr:phosphoglycerate dehydrogenase [Anatilimnocola aggregata]QDU28391.1 D-3-phosphoglycerate dehydrogenase [Anatilimnocola aggregata]